MGELAALAAAMLWSLTSVFFTFAGQQVGSVIVNRTRLLLALLYLLITHTFLFGLPLPIDAEPQRWGWLALSGVIGLALGDGSLFQAYVMIGPRLSMLVMALSPVISTVLAWFLLGERLALVELAAIVFTLGGIAWVVLERRGEAVPVQSKRLGWGLLAALGGAVGQALGLIAAKKGLVGTFPALSAVVIRMLAAVVVMWGWTALSGGLGKTASAWRNWKALRWILAASFLGAFLGVWLSVVAIDNAPVGIASTIMALPPVFLLPLSRLFFREPITWRAVVGTLVAVGGVAALALL